MWHFLVLWATTTAQGGRTTDLPEQFCKGGSQVPSLRQTVVIIVLSSLKASSLLIHPRLTVAPTRSSCPFTKVVCWLMYSCPLHVTCTENVNMNVAHVSTWGEIRKKMTRQMTGHCKLLDSVWCLTHRNPDFFLYPNRSGDCFIEQTWQVWCSESHRCTYRHSFEVAESRSGRDHMWQTEHCFRYSSSTRLHTARSGWYYSWMLHNHWGRAVCF